MNKVLGITLIVLALAIAILPSFADCASQGNVLTLASGKEIPMKCHWTAKAEIAVGIPLLAAGAMMVTTRRKSNLLILGIMGCVLGVVAIMLTTNSLIGVCTTPTMVCRTLMKPTLTILGSLAIAASVGIIVLSRKAKD
jgi:hypothetical protein